MSAAERESEENEKGRELGGQNRSNPPIQQHVGQQLFHNIDNDCFIISTTIVPKLKVRSEGPYGVSELFGKANRGSRRWVGVRAGQHRVGVQLLHKGQNQKSAKKSPIFDFRIFSLGLPGAPQGQILGATCQAQGQEPLSCTDSDVSFSLWRYLDFSR